MDVLLANPRGFCAGVDRAIEIVKRALETLGAPIYVRHEVVHNRFVVDDLKHRGAIFVEELDEVPDNATVIFSAHGVSQAVRQEAARRGLKVFDATCPLVTKVHLEVARQCRAGRDMVLIGHAGHPEVEGTMGQWNAHAGQGSPANDASSTASVIGASSACMSRTSSMNHPSSPTMLSVVNKLSQVCEPLSSMEVARKRSRMRRPEKAERSNFGSTQVPGFRNPAP